MDEIIKHLNDSLDRLSKKVDYINASCVMQEHLDNAADMEVACAKIREALDLLTK